MKIRKEALLRALVTLILGLSTSVLSVTHANASYDSTAGNGTIACTSGYFTVASHTVVSQTGCAGAVNIPDDVTALSSSVFADNAALTSIRIGQHLSDLGSESPPFYSNPSLATVEVDSRNTTFTVLDRVLYSTTSGQIRKLVLFPAADTRTTFTVPSGVTEIGWSAFDSDSNLTSVNLPSGLTTIGNSAFYGDTHLSSVYLPDSLNFIDDQAFQSTPNLVSLEFGTGLLSNSQTFMSDSFDPTLKSISIRTGATSIGFTKFANLIGVEQLTIPNTVTSIGVGAFQFMTDLKTVTFQSGSTLGIINNYAFWGDSSLTAINVPSSVTAIGNQVFQDNTSLTSVTLHEGLTTLGNQVFKNCNKLTSVHLPDSITNLGFSIFQQDPKIISINIPDGVTSIDGGTFDGITDSLASLEIGSGVASIASYTFQSLSNLAQITVKPANATFSSSNGVLFDKTQATLFLYPPKKTDLTYSIPNTVTSFTQTQYPFIGVAHLTSLSIPAALTSLGANPFYNLTELASIDVNSGNANYSSDSGVLFNKTKSTLLLYPSAKGNPTYSIPLGVATVDDNAFTSVRNLVSISIPNSVSALGPGPFWDCNQLSSVTVDSSNTTYRSEDGVLIDRAQQSLLLYPHGKTASSYTLPNSVVTFDQVAFIGVSRLTSLILPDNVTSIPSYSLQGMDNLSSIVIGNGVTSIPSNMFSGLNSLASVSIGNGVTSIGDNAFVWVTSLTSVTLGDHVESIGAAAFDGTSISTISIPASVTSISSDLTFANNPFLKTVFLNSCTSEIRSMPRGTQFQNNGTIEFVSSTPCNLAGGVHSVTSATPSGTLSLPRVLTFPPTRYGQSSTLTFTVSNIGSAALNPFGPKSFDSNTLPDFTYQTNCPQNSLAAGSSCTVSLTFTPVLADVEQFDLQGVLYWNGYSNGPDVGQNLYGQIDEALVAGHSISISQGVHGTITSSVSGLISDGDTPTYTFTPDAGYQLDAASVDGSTISTGLTSGQIRTYTFSSVTSDHTITASFKLLVSTQNSSPSVSITRTSETSQRAVISRTLSSATLPSTTVLPNVTLRFTDLIDTGTVTVTQVANPTTTAATPFDISRAKILDIQVSGISGNVTVCIDGNSSDQIYHFSGGQWVELSSRTYLNGQVCGITSSFSPFAVGSLMPVMVPDPLQQSKIASFAPITAVTGTATPIMINGTFIEKVSAIQVNGVGLAAGSWIQTPTSVSFTMPGKTAGEYQIQLYNGSAPVMKVQNFTFTAPVIAVPKPVPAATAKPKVIYIQCVKPGKGTRTAYGVNPVCPAGFTKK